ncbi:Uncharacterized conserved protein YkwD, contains CAP (CSP/antigen 5/PR1) domain [Jatrophihabitans endophyticus]|uniref:Uncharacterized conserved protein YkwD, contains CAP (CSP/antigen 5/PR1) domain n=1 Tax=Jatrophihabitans endophyticus TaxID=1206085 RepID=A0A1M5HSK1_9ACTN|nr:CAP domain-containing protein [Jatrophihabitans endophyticus]SHG18917.1 Uncharacterized conserved protein YkwD, contains CAP (CSP/antigen 5/PR1) domain [Jatrophihabitans endophyticus]
MYPRSRALFVALLTLLAVLATAVVTAPASSAASHRMTRLEVSFSNSVVKLINAQRRQHHLKPVKLNRYLTLASDRHNRAMARVNTISHQLSGEKDFVARDRAAGFRYRCWGGENIGVSARVSRAGARELQSLMYAEKAPNDGHRQNILNRHYTMVGVAVLRDARNGRLWLTTDFGSRC